MAVGRLGVDLAGLSRFLERVHRRFPLERAILFGSRARGTELEESDYDVILVSESFAEVSFTERIRAVQDAWDLPEALEVFCYTPAEFRRQQGRISTVAEAVREGRSLPLPRAEV